MFDYVCGFVVVWCCTCFDAVLLFCLFCVNGGVVCVCVWRVFALCLFSWCLCRVVCVCVACVSCVCVEYCLVLGFCCVRVVVIVCLLCVGAVCVVLFLFWGVF